MKTSIQLRGISRTPSDRMSADGGVADSINLQMDSQELVPVIAPASVISTGQNTPVHIHKTTSYEHYLCVLKESSPVAIVAYGVTGKTGSVNVLSLGQGENFIDCKTIGNVVIVSGSQATHYAIYKPDDTTTPYHSLGSKVPVPTVNISVSPYTDTETFRGFHQWIDSGFYNSEWSAIQIWNNIHTIANSTSSTLKDSALEFLSEHKKGVWDNLNAARKSLNASDVFTAPTMVRYAVKLISGDVAYVSAPIMLVGDGGDEIYKVRSYGYNIGVSEVKYGITTKFEFTHLFKASMSVTFSSLGDWGELIESVDLYASVGLHSPYPNSEASSPAEATTDTYQSNAMYKYPFKNNADTYAKELQSSINKIDSFYRVLSIKAGSGDTTEKIKPFTDDDLVVKQRLSLTDAHTISSHGEMFTYNNRLVLAGANVKLTSGLDRPNALRSKNLTPLYSASPYYIVYYLKDDNGSIRTIHGFSNYSIEPGKTVPFIAYPDERCFKAVIYNGDPDDNPPINVVTMDTHPYLNIAYAFTQLNATIEDLGEQFVDGDEGYITYPADSSTYSVANKLYMSEMDNPWVWPMAERHKFTGSINGIAATATALSTGLYGKYSMYVFCSDGIWAANINDSGEIMSYEPVSREVAVKDSFCLLDQAVMYSTANGVRVLAGNQSQDVSTQLLGEPYSILHDLPSGNDMLTALKASAWSSVIDDASSQPTFMSFLDYAHPLYDYAGKRVIYFGNSSYAMVLKLDTTTWHRIKLERATNIPLNAYPDAYAAKKNEDGTYTICNYSQNLKSAPNTDTLAMLVTRPFDLENPDILKSIQHIRVRGSYNELDANGNPRSGYILFGSQDGVNFKRLTTLKGFNCRSILGGKSYKSFKLMLFAKLKPYERISWIDVDFVTRFTNKLR